MDNNTLILFTYIIYANILASPKTKLQGHLENN